MVAAEARICVATQQAAPTRPWIGTGDARKMTNAIDWNESKTFTSAAQENSSAPTIRDIPCKKMEAWQMFRSINNRLMQPTSKKEQNGTHRKTEVVDYVADLDAALLD